MTESSRPSIFTEAEWKAFQARLHRPAKEQLQCLVERGVIDSEGNVLIRMPHFGEDTGRAPKDNPVNGQAEANGTS